jgi:hypothetical protein
MAAGSKDAVSLEQWDLSHGNDLLIYISTYETDAAQTAVIHLCIYNTY